MVLWSPPHGSVAFDLTAQNGGIGELALQFGQQDLQ